MNSSRRNRVPVLALLVANAVSLIGTRLSLIALPWFVLQTTGSAAQAGLTGFAIALPGFLVGIFGGTLVDRIGYRRTSVIADLVSGVAIGLIPTLHYSVGLAFWQLLILVFLSSMLDIPALTARRSLLPELANLAGIRLERANAAFESIQYVSLLLGPPIAGLLIAQIGASSVLWIDTATYAVSATVIGIAIPTLGLGSMTAKRGRYLGELREGLRFLLQDRLLRALAVSLLLTNMLSGPLVAVILPVYATRVFGQATDLGWMITASGAGSLLGAAVFGAIGHRLPRRALWITGFIVSAAPFWVLATGPSLLPMVAVLAVSGTVSGPLNPLLVTVRHERIPPPLRGRVFSTFSAISVAASPLGMLFAGNAVEWLGFQPAVLLFAGITQLIGIGMFFVPAFHEMERSRGGREFAATEA